MADKYTWLGSKTDGPQYIKIGGKYRGPGYELPPGALAQRVLDHYVGIGEMECIVESTQRPSRLIETPDTDTDTDTKPEPKAPKKASKRRKRSN